MDTVKYKWKTVNLDEFGIASANTNFEGLLGIEECLDYSVLSKNKARKKALKEKYAAKRQASPSTDVNVTPKKSKNDSGFQVENIKPNVTITPTKATDKESVAITKNKKEKTKSKENVSTNGDTTEPSKKAKKKKKPKVKKGKKQVEKDDVEDNDGESEVPNVSPNAVPIEDMQAWTQFSIPQEILRALADQGFTNPTKIQELTLPATLHGRRDILGAAETGSGKTLAFGIPILAGILRLKENARDGIQEKSDIIVPQAPTNPFANDKSKLVNFNKLNSEEKKALLREIKGKKKFKKRKFISAGSDEEEDDEDDDDDEDSDEDDSDDNEDVASSDDEISVDEDGLDPRDSDMESADSDADVGIESDQASLSDDEKNPSDKDESDFEEREEEVEGVNDEGIGCVKVIDNVVPPSGDIIPLGRVAGRGLRPLYALVLTPTRELAIQVRNHIVAAAKYTDIQVGVVIGGLAEVKQERVLRRGPEVVVATPGRLWQMLQQGNRHLSQLADIRYLAIDETDRMLERGHFEELHQLLGIIKEGGGRRQTFVFSATLTLVHDLPHHLKGRKVTKKGKVINRKAEKLTAEQKLKKVIEMMGITDPKVVDVTVQNQGASGTLTECRISCPIDHKDFYLYYVLKQYPGRTIVFCNSIGCVKRLAQLFGLLQCAPLPLHANMQQRQRLKNLDKFRDRPHGLLVATDVAARGLDIPNVEHVIHYQVPRTAENYVHRSGRTARASREGIAILIMEPTEAQNYTKMCRTLSKTEDLPHFPVDGALLAAVRRRVELARELDAAALQQRKRSAQRGWLEKAAMDMDILIDEMDKPQLMENEIAADLKNILVVKKKQLNSLLASPLFPKGFSFRFPTNNMLEHALGPVPNQNAVQAMKSAMDSGQLKKFKKSGKNEAILNLETAVQKMVNSTTSKPEFKIGDGAASNENDVLNNGVKLSKNKWKKFKRNKA